MCPTPTIVFRLDLCQIRDLRPNMEPGSRRLRAVAGCTGAGVTSFIDGNPALLVLFFGAGVRSAELDVNQ
jgi:hypothetical protein